MVKIERRTRLLRGLLVLALAGLGSHGCSPPSGARSEAAGKPAADLRIADRLYFGRDIPSGGTVSEADWQGFLRDVVTPRFPDGLTEWRAHGQWRGANGEIVREESFVLELIHAPGADADTKVT